VDFYVKKAGSDKFTNPGGYFLQYCIRIYKKGL
jgi:hypothetical protein